MFERIQAMYAKWQEIREIQSLSSTELDDLGLSRAQIEFFARMPADVPDRMAQMASVFGLTEDQIKKDYTAYIDLLDVCGHCGARRACGKTLAHVATAQPEDVGFCPNAGTYADMAAPVTR